jgi:2,4'-dihydroxyacetophenone dioxygenase
MNTEESNSMTDTPNVSPAMPAGMPGLDEVLLKSEEIAWRPKSLKGLYEKVLWRDDTTGASICLIKFEKGVSIPEPHMHAANQFMFCLEGLYQYKHNGLTLKPGSFYWNPKGNVHGPTIALEETVVVEIFDGPHYPQRPSWYDNDQDAR